MRTRTFFSYAFYALCGLIFLFLILPIFVVIPISFSSAVYLKFPPPGFSLQWYQKFFQSPDWIDATVLSIEIASATTITATILGTLLAFPLVRGNFRGKSLIFAFALSPMIVPLIVTAIAIYFFFAKIGFLGTFHGLVTAHTILAIPFVLVIVSAALKNFDETLERAALNLGANPIQTFFFVTLPVIRPSVMSAALFAFITSFDELVVVIFISTTRAMTLPKRMWDGIRLEIDPTIAAVSSMLIAVSAILLVCMELLRKRGASRF